jgi:hypothetical protein
MSAQFVREAVPHAAMKWLFVGMISAPLLSAFRAEAEQPASFEAPTTAKIDVAAGQGGEEVSQLLEPIKVKMDQAASALNSRDLSGRATVAQQEAVKEIDLAIARLQKQTEKLGGKGGEHKSGENKSAPGARSMSAPDQTNVTAATHAAAPADRAAINGLVKDLWGRLPQRQRDELLQPLSEEFLPAYAAEIEEYFRVLAGSSRSETAKKRQ